MALENSMLVIDGKQVGGDTEDLTAYQTKTDNTLQTNSKQIPGAINELNSNLTALDGKIDGVIDTTSVSDVKFMKIGRMVYMAIEVWKEIFTIPAKYRPLVSGYFAVRSSLQGSGNDIVTYVRIGTDGTMSLGANDTFVGTLSWIAANLD